MGCEALSLVEIAQRAAEVVRRTRDGKPRADDLDGSTFTVSNLGMYGIRQFEAIINPPNVAILAVGAVRIVPVYDERGSVIPAQILTVTLSADPPRH